MRTLLAIATVCVATLFGSVVDAQTTTASRGYFALEGGANIERAEDDLHGTTAGAGALLGITVSDRWAVEGEFWYPGWIRTGPEGGRHHDTLASVGARWSFGGARVIPHLLFGGSVEWTADEFTTCVAMRPPFGSTTAVATIVSCTDPDVVERHQERFSNAGVFPLVGAGAEIALTRRIRLMPDVRVQVGMTSVIVRPAIAMGIAF